MIKTAFSFKFQGRFYCGLFEKQQPVGSEVSRFKITDIDPADFVVPEPFYIAGNYDDNAYSFPASSDENLEFLHAVTDAVIAECERKGVEK